MGNSFYQQIEDEEAARIAANVATETKLQVLAESSRLEFFCGEWSKERIVSSALFLGLMVFLIQLPAVPVWLALVIGGLLLELYWTQERLKASNLLLKLQAEKGS